MRHILFCHSKPCSKIHFIAMVFITCCLFVSCQLDQEDGYLETPLIQYVDPFIGTDGHGHTFPGATVPFGAVQLSPDNGVTGWDWCSGYHYSDSVIVGFGHMHLSGTGIGDLTDIRIMPTSNEVDITKKVTDRLDNDYAGKYSHDEEKASPGFYEVKLSRQNIKVSLSATTRAGIQMYEYPKGSKRSVIIDLAHAVNWDKPVGANLKMVGDSMVTGYRYSSGWAKDQRVYFAIVFSEPIQKYEFSDSTKRLDGNTQEGIQLKSLLHFDSSTDRPLLVKTGISSASVEGATKSLSEIPNWDFNQVRRQAEQRWNDELSKIRISSTNEDLKTTFYTAMYHAQLAPIVYSDLNGEYKGPNGKVNKAQGYTRYDIFSLWDTFRASHPLFTILQPERIDDMVNSLLAHYDEYGLLPVWSLLGNETNTMTGYHAIPVITDAYFKGFRGFNVENAYEAMKKSAMQEIRGVSYYKEYGYIPSDLEVESVTKNLEYAYDDWCIAQMAKALGYQDDFEYFNKRAESYKLLFDAEVGFMRGRLSNRQWREPFDPKRSEHRIDTDYTEGNAWQHTWFVPHDVLGLKELMGGANGFEAKLDSLFTIDSEVTGKNVSADISGMIGQYAHGNEPSHHVAYLYNFTKNPWKTQNMVRKILTTQYDTSPAGLCGNDDCGQMSAWYIFSALGFYPLNPANGIYQIGNPLFAKSSIDVGDGKSFTTRALGVSEQNKFIQDIRLNGEKLDRLYLKHKEIMSGGELLLTMGPKPMEIQ